MTGCEKVLFIDDEKHIRQANKQTLELANLDVIIEDCAEKGLEILTREWPGVVVCDIRLPQMDLNLVDLYSFEDRDIELVAKIQYH